MKCCQCDNVAIYKVTEQDIPLCLDCYFRFSQIEQQRQESNERMLNYISDQMAFSVGVPSIGARFPPRPRPVVMAGTKLHNIQVNNSVVGTINTGSIGTVDQSITALVQSGEPELAQAIKELSEAILQSGDLTRNQKNELIESLSTISREAATPEGARQNTVATSLLNKVMKVTALANDITDVCKKWWPVLLLAFSAARGG